MSGKRTEMDRLQELVRLHRMETGYREVARLLGMSPNTERQYRQILEEEGLLHGPAGELPDPGALRAVVAKHLPESRPPQQMSSVERWTGQVEQMLSKGAKPKAIYDCLRLEDEQFRGSLSAIKRLCCRIEVAKGIEAEDVVIPVLSAPGEIAQVDFGYVGKLYDPERGVLRKAWVFVMVLTYSRHMFARVAFDQRVETWLRLHVEAFTRFGGVIDTVVPDNLKSAVVRCAFGFDNEPTLNRSYRELARYYGFKIDPTPPLCPQKKGGVESAVKYVKNNFFKPRDFDDIDDSNRRLDVWVAEIAGERTHGTTGKRPVEVFEQIERASLKPLPATPYEPVVWKKAKVHRDSRIEFERRLYPVPWRLIGKELWVRATPSTVAAYWEETRVATHQRGKPVAAEVYDQYLPEHRRSLRYRSESFWLERAEQLGKEVADYIREIFAQDDGLSHLRTVQAIVTHLESFPAERARAACVRAQYYGNHTYPGVRAILRKGIDRDPLPVAVAPARNDHHRPRFARNVRELLQLSLMEDSYDTH